MKKLTLGKKIITGFMALVLIAILLGVVAVVQMNGVKDDSVRLAQAYVPEVAISNDMERGALMMMYEIRGYGFTEEDGFLRDGIKHYQEVVTSLDESKTLAQEQNLKKLSELEPQARKAATDYHKLVLETEALNTTLTSEREEMNAAAAAFTQNVTAFIEGQEGKMRSDVADRLSKVKLSAEVLNLGNQARIQNFKGQASNDLSQNEEAIATIRQLAPKLKKLKDMSSDPQDIAWLEEIEQTSKQYAQAIDLYVAHKKGTNATSMAEISKQLDSAAADYVEASQSYFNGQLAKTEKDILERSTKVTLANNVVDHGNEARVLNFKSQATRDPQTMREAMAKVDAIMGVTAEVLTITRQADDIAMVKNTEEAALTYKEAMKHFLNAWLKREQVGLKREEAGMKLLEVAQTTAETGMTETRGIAQSSMTNLGAASSVMQGGLVVAAILGITLALLITRSITGPLNRIIEGLSNGAEQTSSASSQVSSASQSLAEGSSEQASSLEETSSSLEEMASMTKRNADNAQEANRLSSDTRKAADSGASEMEEMSKAMEAIKSSSDDISKIIKTIDEIAFQTNILALNAAVEAARAGEAGMGFAVVADEVRSLAQRSAVAARETADKIEDAVSKSEQGVNISGRVAASLKEIVEKARQVDGLVAEIASASNEQNQGIHQINEAVAQMDQVTQNNAANAEETASASEELNAQSEELRSVVQELMAMVGGSGGSLAHALGDGRNGRTMKQASHPHALHGSHGGKKHTLKESGAKHRLTGESGKAKGSDDELADFSEDDFKDF